MFEFQRPDGKLNWPYLRQIFYVLLIVWVVGVQWANVNPFDDFGEGPGQDVTIATLLDFVSLVAIYLFAWHVMYPARPRV